MPKVALGHRHFVEMLKSEDTFDKMYAAMAIGNSSRTGLIFSSSLWSHISDL